MSALRAVMVADGKSLSIPIFFDAHERSMSLYPALDSSTFLYQ